MCSRGDIPTAVKAYFFGALFCAFRKIDGGVRPIAVGCILRRVVSKASCMALRDKASALLAPRQLGIGVRDGVIAAAHAARRFLGSCDESEGILKLDFKNAFNEIDRSAVLKAVYTSVPELSSYAFASYGAASILFNGTDRLSSACGVQQGDPLGPLLFSLTVRPLTSAPL